VKVSQQSTVFTCDICARTLLLGEKLEVFRDGADRRTVCALCASLATARGWRREGAPMPPPLGAHGPRAGLRERLRRRRSDRRREVSVADLYAAAEVPPSLGPHKAGAPEHRRLVDEQRQAASERAVDIAIETFNLSPYRRTVSGIAKSLGRPRISVIALGGTRPDVVVTVAWELSWYQYRVDPTTRPAVRLEGRGDDVAELPGRWRAWNASTTQAGEVELGAAPSTVRR
jgi:hypothetical protein